jgi:hypothetical protein
LRPSVDRSARILKPPVATSEHRDVLLRRLVIATLLLAAALVAPSPAAALELGLNVNGGAAGGTAENFAQLSETGARWARHFVVFAGQDGTDGGYDTIVEREQAMGVKTLFVVTGVGGAPPADQAAYARFVGRLAARYRGKVDAYEIWNEQDEPLWWSTPDVGAYVRLLRAAHGAIKAADPAAKVVFGPTTANNYEFLERAYAAGAKGSFDAMAVHTDTACLDVGPTHYYRDRGRIGRFSFLGYREVRATMLHHGDDKPIWMTEFGWSASTRRCERIPGAGPDRSAGVGEADQARHLREAYSCMRRDPYVTVAMWFNSRDLSSDGSELDSYGLKRADGSDRPAAAAFRDAAAGRDTIAAGCGDFDGPQVRVLSPAPGAKFGARDTLHIRAVSPDPDVTRISFAVAGADDEIRNHTNGGKPLTEAQRSPSMEWHGFRELPYGRHTILVTAKDVSGNETTERVEVERLDPARMAAQPVSVAALRLGGRGRSRVLTGALITPLRIAVDGTVRVEWQTRRAGGWRKVHGGGGFAHKPFRFDQKLRYGGRWRVRVRFIGQRPFRSTYSRWIAFRAG